MEFQQIYYVILYPVFYPTQILYFLGTSKVLGNDAKPNMIGKVLQENAHWFSSHTLQMFLDVYYDHINTV